MILDYYSKEKTARVLANKSNLSISYHNNGLCKAYTTKDTIYVQQPDPLNWEESDFLLWDYCIAHEIGHHQPETRDIFDLLKEKKVNTQSMFGFVVNLLDDHRQERNRIDEYRYRRRIREEGRLEFLKRTMNIGAERKNTNQELAFSLFAWDTDVRCGFMPVLSSMSRDLINQANQEHMEILREFSERLSNLGTAEDVYTLAKDICQALEIEEESQEDQAFNYVLIDHSDEGEAEEESDKESRAIDKVKASGTFTPRSTQYVEDIKVTEGQPDYRCIGKLVGSSKTFSKKVLSFLLAMKLSRWQHGLKKGKLDGKRLYRLIK